jgi:hypothetical protein
MTNKEFAKTDKAFQEACAKVKLPQEKHKELGLSRQAGKWQRKTGKAYKEGRS